MTDGLQPPEQQEKRSTLWLYVAFIFIVFGAKAVIISNFGSSIPFWDQWDSEADLLYRPWFEGTLRWVDLFSSHNEHRIFTTKIFGLLLLYLNQGVWDPMFEMYVNAAVHTVTLAFLLFLLQKGLHTGTRYTFFFLAALLFAIPYGYENTLAGFQVQFYFLLLFSFLFLWAVTRFGTGSKLWFPVIVFAAFMSFFSLASGVMTIAAGSGTMLIRWLWGIQRTRAAALIIMLLSIAVVTAFYFTPVIPRHAVLRAKTLLDFVIAILQATGGGVLYIPVVLFMIKQLQNKPPVDDHSWFVFSLCLWIAGQILAVAYGRSSGILSSRYLDLLAIGFLLNGYCLLDMLQKAGDGKILKNSIVLWVFLVTGGIGFCIPSITKHIGEKKAVCLRNEENVRTYLATRNYASIQKTPYEEIPYPSAARLKSFLDNNTISFILTPVVNSNNTREGLGFYKTKTRKILYVIGSMLMFLGVALFVVGSIEPRK